MKAIHIMAGTAAAVVVYVLVKRATAPAPAPGAATGGKAGAIAGAIGALRGLFGAGADQSRTGSADWSGAVNGAVDAAQELAAVWRMPADDGGDVAAELQAAAAGGVLQPAGREVRTLV